MSQYLTYGQYQANGGKTERSAFPALEHLARKKLDYWTQNRIQESNPDIQLAMTLIVEALAEVRENQAGTASSFSNDGVSVNLSKPARTESEIMASVYDQIVEILPVELVSVVIR